jgi:3-dehydroquinate dehydratase-1
MPALKRVKIARNRPLLVGVITSGAELRRAARMSDPPDLFELRLDWLFNEKDLDKKAVKLNAPLIITARHPAEGGNERLSNKTRRELLVQFLPIARYLDIELRSARLYRTVIDRAKRNGMGTIISFHDFESTPSLGSLRAKASRAAGLRADVFKVVTRTDTGAQLDRLLRLMSEGTRRMPIAAMGMGKLGRVSRLLFAQCGSVLIYTSLGKPRVDGQLSLEHFRAAQRGN